MRTRLAGASLIALAALCMGALAPATAGASHNDPKWRDSDCGGPFNCPIYNPRCSSPPDRDACSPKGKGRNRIWRKNVHSQRFDIPGTNEIRWPITLPAMLRDGFGNDRAEIVARTTKINYGQLKMLRGRCTSSPSTSR